jgi:hypothetical protein
VRGRRIFRELGDIGAALAHLQGGRCTVEAVGAARVWTARVGRPGARHQVVITAGLHAAEILGVAAALACVRAAKASGPEDVCFHVLPAADAANVERNAQDVLRAGRLAGLLELSSPKDLEHALWPTAPETDAVRAWLDTIGSVDAYLSFHAASCLSGGAFFYVQGDGPLASALIASLRAEVARSGIPLLPRDPTPVPSRILEPGFFGLQDLGRGALAHVHERFAPRVSLVSEIPVGVVAGAGSADRSAESYAELSRIYAAEVSAGRPSTVQARLVDPADHVRCLVMAAMDLGRCLSDAPPNPRDRARRQLVGR